MADNKTRIFLDDDMNASARSTERQSADYPQSVFSRQPNNETEMRRNTQTGRTGILNIPPAVVNYDEALEGAKTDDTVHASAQPVFSIPQVPAEDSSAKEKSAGFSSAEQFSFSNESNPSGESVFSKKTEPESAGPKQPLKSPRTRPTISTSRVFSPFDLSFFEDPVTTRELSPAERGRIANRTSGKSGQSFSNTQTSRIITPETNVFPTDAASGMNNVSRPAGAGRSAVPNPSAALQATGRNTYAAPQNAGMNTFTASPSSSSKAASGRILTPESNVFPEDAGSPKPAARPASAPAQKPAASRILTPDNNFAPEDARSVINQNNSGKTPASASVPVFTVPSNQPAASSAAHTPAAKASSASPSTAQPSAAKTSTPRKPRNSAYAGYVKTDNHISPYGYRMDAKDTGTLSDRLNSTFARENTSLGAIPDANLNSPVYQESTALREAASARNHRPAQRAASSGSNMASATKPAAQNSYVRSSSAASLSAQAQRSAAGIASAAAKTAGSAAGMTNAAKSSAAFIGATAAGSAALTAAASGASAKRPARQQHTSIPSGGSPAAAVKPASTAPAASNTGFIASGSASMNRPADHTAHAAPAAPVKPAAPVSAKGVSQTAASAPSAASVSSVRPAKSPVSSAAPSGTQPIKFSEMKEASLPPAPREPEHTTAGTASVRTAAPVKNDASANEKTMIVSTSHIKKAAAAGAASAPAASSEPSAKINETKTKVFEPLNFDVPEAPDDTDTFLFTGRNLKEDAGKTMAIDAKELEHLETVSPEQQPAKMTKTTAVPAKKKKTARTVRTDHGGPAGPDNPGRRPSSAGGESSRRQNGIMPIITVILCIAVVLELIGGITAIVVGNRIVSESPDLNLTDFVGEESTKIYDDSGELITEVGVYLRQNISYDRLPESLVDAFLSVEDSRFFSHFGFDVPRFTKALIENIKTHSFGQGGSTFTMQLVKNTYFSVESMDAENTGTERVKSIEYKIQQIYLAMKLENLLSKKEIFTLYLNKLNFGGNIRGVQRAAQYYFGKNCNELNLSEAAMLAGIVNLPNRYNPYDYLDYGTTRRNEVLNLMNHHGYLTDDELKLAKGIKVENTLVGETREAAEDSQYQSYIDVVLEEAMAVTGADPTIKGMNIYTHLNRAMQEQVEAIQNGETAVVYPDDLMQVAMISMDNRDGSIIAVGGGRNYDGARLLNRATMNYKQPGSSVKPLLSYGLAFEYLGYSLDEVLLDKPITYPMESMVLVNASGNYQGDVTIKDAVGNSLNIPAILTLERVVNKIGAEKVVEYLQTIGFSRVKQENFHLSYAIGGTTFETTCKELAGAHSMLINKGVYNQPHTIEKIVMSSDGSEYYPQNQNVRALSSGSAYLCTELEANNVTGPYFNYMQVLARNYPVYAKTGTTDWGNDGVQYGIPRGQMKDKWMVASTSQYTNCVWVGYDKAEAGKETYYTSYKSALNIPGNINRLLLDKEEELFGAPEAIPAPEDLEDVTYIYGSFPHIRSDFAIDGGGLVTSKVAKAGLKSMPLATVDEYLEYSAKEAEYLGLGGMSAKVDQFGILTVSWGGGAICSGGQRNIGLHDPYNNIDQWGACLADLSWLVGGGEYWGTVYCDDVPVAEISSNNGFYSGYAADLYGEVKVCGGSKTKDGSDNTACTVAQYIENPNANGYVDENGNWVQLPPDYSQYGYWDENGTWVGQGYWDANGFHPE